MIYHNKILIIALLLATTILSECLKERPEIVTVDYTEQLLDIIWKPVSNATGYNIYSRNTKQSINQKRKINKKLITSGNHFAFIWEFENGERVKKIKGYEHIVSIEAVCSTSTKTVYSNEIDNFYFEGFRNIIDGVQIKKIVEATQKTEQLDGSLKNNSLLDFMKFMASTGKLLNRLVADSINPLQVGGCAPITTVVVELLDRYGISAYKAEGTFIKEYHSFVIIKIDNVEYVLDFTADQFLPGVSPVMIPRDRCFINDKGRLDLSGKAIYKIGKLYRPEDISLLENDDSRMYRAIRDSVIKVMLNSK